MKSKMQTNNTSGFRGVAWDNSRKKWRASIKFEKSLIYLGRYDDINDAALAYDEAAVDLFGIRFAQTNFDKKNYIDEYWDEISK